MQIDGLRVPASLQNLVVEPDKITEFIPKSGVIAFGGMVGMAMPKESSSAISRLGDGYNLTLLTGGTTTSQFDKELSTIQVTRRYPVASGKFSRTKANSGQLHIFDYWLSEYSRLIRYGGIPHARSVDLAFIEATGITDEGIVLSLSVDAAPAMVEVAEKVVVEINLSKPLLYNLHDVCSPKRGEYVFVKDVLDRIGSPVLKCPKNKIKAVIVTDKPEPGAGAYSQVGSNEIMIAENINEILGQEWSRRISDHGKCLQPGAGPLASALLDNLDFQGLRIWAEAVTVDWALNIGKKVDAISASCIYALQGQERMLQKFYDELDEIIDSILLRPYEITNRAEIISNLELISIQQAIEVDIYGNANVSHIRGEIYNGVGGSGDFSRNAYLTILALPSATSDLKFSRIVPICSHVDITEHDVDFVVTEKGWVDLRGLSPRERAERIIETCVHEKFREPLLKYFKKACSIGGHEPVSFRDALEFWQQMK